MYLNVYEVLEATIVIILIQTCHLCQFFLKELIYFIVIMWQLLQRKTEHIQNFQHSEITFTINDPLNIQPRGPTKKYVNTSSTKHCPSLNKKISNTSIVVIIQKTLFSLFHSPDCLCGNFVAETTWVIWYYHIYANMPTQCSKNPQAWSALPQKSQPHQEENSKKSRESFLMRLLKERNTFSNYRSHLLSFEDNSKSEHATVLDYEESYKMGKSVPLRDHCAATWKAFLIYHPCHFT